MSNLLEDMTKGFTDALLWSCAERLDTDPETGLPNGDLQGSEVTPNLYGICKSFCREFIATVDDDDLESFMDAFGDPDGGLPAGYLGHTFYLNAAGSGVSFTDRAWRSDDPMTAVCVRLGDIAVTFSMVEWIHAYEQGDGVVDGYIC